MWVLRGVLVPTGGSHMLTKLFTDLCRMVVSCWRPMKPPPRVRRLGPHARWLLSTMLLILSAPAAHAQVVTTKIQLGTPGTVGPLAISVNPVTNRIYEVNQNSTVVMIDGATNNIFTVKDPMRTLIGPVSLAVNPATNTIYVANAAADVISVIDGTTNTITTGILEPTGSCEPTASSCGPMDIAVNAATNTIYVLNTNNAVTVIDGGTNTVTATVKVKTGTNGTFAVNPVSNKIYVASALNDNFSVINGADNTFSTIALLSGDSVGTAVVLNPVTNRIYASVGNTSPATPFRVTVIDGMKDTVITDVTDPTNGLLIPVDMAVDPATNKIYVSDASGPNTVSAIDGTTNALTDISLGGSLGGPESIAVDPVSNRVYVNLVQSNKVVALDGTTHVATTLPLPGSAAGNSPISLGVNPVTDKIYVTSTGDFVGVIDGADYATATVTTPAFTSGVAVNIATHRAYVTTGTTSASVIEIDEPTNTTTTVVTGVAPNAVAVNPLTNEIYAANFSTNNVTVIDGATRTSASVPVGKGPNSIVVNPTTNKIYVANYQGSSVTVIDGATNLTATIAVGSLPYGLAVDTVTNQIYVANQNSDTVTVIDGATNSVAATITVGSGPLGVAVNTATNTIYVANSVSGNVSVINGATNSVAATVPAGTTPFAVALYENINTVYVANQGTDDVTVINGANNTVTATVTVGTTPTAIAANPVTGKIYVANSKSDNVTEIDAATNTITTITAGTGPQAIAVDRVAGQVFVANYSITTGSVTVISEQQVSAIPLTTTITPIEGNVTESTQPVLSFTALSSYSPNVPPVQQVFYRMDNWRGPWLTATGTAPNFSGAPSVPLKFGTHVVYAYSEDAQEGDSIQPSFDFGPGNGGSSSPMIGAIAPYLFAVVPPRTFSGTGISLSAGANPSFSGTLVTFHAAVTGPGDTPTGTIQFMDGATALGPVLRMSNGTASFSTSTLTVGIHNITAVYSGDVLFRPNASLPFTQVVLSNTGSASVTSVSVNGSSSSAAPAYVYFGEFNGIHGANITVSISPSTASGASSIILLDNEAQLGPLLTPTAGTVTINTQLTIGDHYIRAIYLGNGIIKGSAWPVPGVFVRRTPRPHPH